MPDDEWNDAALAAAWAESSDDLDSVDWENANSLYDRFITVDDDHSVDDFDDEDEDDSHDPDYSWGDVDDEYEQPECAEMKEASPHQIAIFDWLVTSGIAEPLRDGQGFIVREGRPVRLQDGRLYDAVSWLSNEGFDGLLVRDLVATQHSPRPGTRQRHFVRFAKVEVLDAPFGDEPSVHVGADEKIPF